MYRIAIIGLVVVLAGLQYRLWVGKGSVAQMHHLQTMHDQLAQANAKNKQRNQVMLAQVANLKAGDSAAETYARSELGMIKPGETFFLTPQSGANTTSQKKTAQE